HHRDPLLLLRPVLPLPSVSFGNDRPPCRTMATGAVGPPGDPVRNVLVRTVDRYVQERRRLPGMRRRVQSPMRGALGLLLRQLTRHHRRPMGLLRSTGEV